MGKLTGVVSLLATGWSVKRLASVCCKQSFASCLAAEYLRCWWSLSRTHPTRRGEGVPPSEREIEREVFDFIASWGLG